MLPPLCSISQGISKSVCLIPTVISVADWNANLHELAYESQIQTACFTGGRPADINLQHNPTSYICNWSQALHSSFLCTLAQELTKFYRGNQQHFKSAFLGALPMLPAKPSHPSQLRFLIRIRGNSASADSKMLELATSHGNSGCWFLSFPAKLTLQYAISAKERSRVCSR